MTIQSQSDEITTAVTVARLYQTFGCLAEATHRQPEDRNVEIQTLDVNLIRSLFLSHGLILFRGFRVDLDSFKVFSDRLCEDFRPHSNVTQRIALTDDATIVTANRGLGQLFLHGEMYYLPAERRPDVLWLYCREPPGKACGGETTVADGVLLLSELSAKTRETFQRQRILYPRSTRKNGKSSTTRTKRLPFSTQAIGRTRAGNDAFINSILNRYQHVGGRRDHPSMVRFEDGSLIPEEIMTELLSTSERVAQCVHWQAGDVAMLDNKWIMHGRRAFSGPRDIVTRMGNLR